MRAFWTLIHRYLGLLTAGFLFVSGVTGAIISWDHELDDVLNPHLMEAQDRRPPRPSLAGAPGRGALSGHPRVLRAAASGSRASRWRWACRRASIRPRKT
jgi:uncharacterized iron-regulated membrane protein